MAQRMNADPRLRPSRLAWPPPGPMEEEPVAIGRRTRLLLVVGAVYIVALTVVVALLVADSMRIRQVRNQQLEDIREEIRVGQCDLLDELPEGGLLERPRAKYGCGPGYPQSRVDPGQADTQTDLTSPPGTATPSPAPLRIPNGPKTVG